MGYESFLACTSDGDSPVFQLAHPIPDYKTTIWVHCLATKRSWGMNRDINDIVKEVRHWHVNDNGWSDIGYAAVIGYDGRVGYGRDLDKDGNVWEETAAAVRGYNDTGIHICLTGGFGSTANDKPEDHFSIHQLLALREFIQDLQEHAGRKLRVRGHNEVAAKACPGFNVDRWWRQKGARSLMESRTIQGGTVGAVGTAGATISAVGQLEGNTQIVFVVFAMLVLVGLAWVFRARISDWANGRR